MPNLRTNRLIYATILVLALIFTFLFGGRVPYSLLYLALALPVLSLALTGVIYARFKYVQDIDSKFVVKGDIVNFIFSVVNEDIFFYPFIKITFFGARTIFAKQFETIAFPIPPRSKQEFKFELSCRYRGTYEIGVSSIEIIDFLGIFKFRFKIPEPMSVTVFPRIIHLQNFELKTDFLSESHTLVNTTQEDMAMVSDIRKMAYGDSLRRIHWKLSAKTGQMLVKRFQSTSEKSTQMFVDTSSSPYSLETNTMIEDKVIECAIALLHYCSTKWIPLEIIYHSRNAFSDILVDNPLMFQRAYKALADAIFDSAAAMGGILDLYMDKGLESTNSIIITSKIDYKLAESLHKMTVRGDSTSLLYISHGGIDWFGEQSAGRIIAHLAEEGVMVYRIGIEEELAPILERR